MLHDSQLELFYNLEKIKCVIEYLIQTTRKNFKIKVNYDSHGTFQQESSNYQA